MGGVDEWGEVGELDALGGFGGVPVCGEVCGFGGLSVCGEVCGLG